MLRLSGVLATTVATLSLGVIAACPAAASPTPTPSPPPVTSTVQPKSQASSQSGTISLTKTRKTFVDLAHTATSPVHTDSKGRIDWRWVKKAYQGHASMRDGFGAGWWARRQYWAQFTQISKDDKKSIVTWAKKNGGPNPTLKVAQRAPGRAPARACSTRRTTALTGTT